MLNCTAYMVVRCSCRKFKLLFSYLDFARAYGLPQRPCLETDTKADFRLTDPIRPEVMQCEYAERCRRWMEAQRKAAFLC